MLLQNFTSDRALLLAAVHRTARLTQQITLTFSPEKLRTSGEHIYTFEQQINLKDGENYLHLGVWDANTGQFGTIRLSVDATRNEPAKKDTK